MALVGLCSVAGAADFQVDSLKDIEDLDPGDGVCLTETGVCSIRAAVSEANALPGADTVHLGIGRARLLFGALDILDDLTIAGVSADLTTIQGDCSHRVFSVAAGVAAAISNLTVKNGGLDSGAGIHNMGDLSLLDVVLTKNVADDAEGGALYNSGTATLERVVILANVGLWGGGVYNALGATLDMVDVTIRRNRHIVGGGGAGVLNRGDATVANSRFLRNQARIGLGGGGIYNAGTLQLTNVTISRNRARLSTAGGLLNDAGGVATLTNVTLVKNQARFVSGGVVNNGTIDIRNTIVSENFNNRVRDVNCGGEVPVVSSGYNIDGGAVCSFAEPGDMSNVKPRLRAEKFNGGFTRSRALREDSPAVDAGDPNDCPSVDQRGVARAVDGDGDGEARCDIGAYEFVLPPDSPALFVSAELPAADASCRAALASGTRSLAGTTIRALLKCEKGRMSGKLDENQVCDDVESLPDASRASVDRAVARLHSSIVSRCDDAAPTGALGYSTCPAPCAELPTVSHNDVATCLACVTTAGVVSTVTTVFGRPDAPFSSSGAGRCFDRSSKAFSKYFTKRLQFEQRCQGDIDRGRLTGITDCVLDDPHGRIAKTWSSVMRLLDTCAADVIPGLELCAVDLPGLKVCLSSTIDSSVDSLFLASMPSP